MDGWQKWPYLQDLVVFTTDSVLFDFEWSLKELSLSKDYQLYQLVLGFAYAICFILDNILFLLPVSIVSLMTFYAKPLKHKTIMNCTKPVNMFQEHGQETVLFLFCFSFFSFFNNFVICSENFDY